MAYNHVDVLGAIEWPIREFTLELNNLVVYVDFHVHNVDRILQRCTVFCSLVFDESTKLKSESSCYKDGVPRTLPDHVTVSAHLTHESCLNHCKRLGFAWCGVEYRHECWCGRNPPDDKLKRPQKECNMRCTGSSQQFCGGGWRINIFQTGKNILLKNEQKLCIYFFPGANCYKDHKERILPAASFASLHMRVEYCIEWCMLRGHRFAGVTYQNQCFCGDDQPSPSRLLPESECNQRCLGDKTQFCGGLNWGMNVYNISLAKLNRVF